MHKRRREADETENRIKAIDPTSPLRGKAEIGESLVSINGNRIIDVLDYKFYAYDRSLTVVLRRADGTEHSVRVRKTEGGDLGLEFESYLMDRARSCANNCVFCFIDQLPPGMRPTMYFKDDDARLSFLLGNYITLTNLSQREIQRIIDLHISPINVSVHTTDPALRCEMLRNPRAGESIDVIRRFARSGIVMNCQIVCCPGLNDGEALERTMRDLEEMYPGVHSVSIVPVGLTKHRQGLCELTPFDRERALETVRQVEAYGEACLERYGSRIFFCADEMYLKAGLPLPEDDFYEDYPQLENGVGLMRLLITEFDAAYEELTPGDLCEFSVATGVSAAPFIRSLAEKAARRDPAIRGTIYPVVNDFFGHTIDVAGLVTGGDIIRQLTGKELGKRLLIPRNMLRQGEGVFLDDVTLPELSEKLGVPVRVVEQDGGDLAAAMNGY